MQLRFPDIVQTQPSLPFTLLAMLLAALCIAGGASMPNVPGQAIVRLVSVAVIVVAILLCNRPAIQVEHAPFWLLIAVAGLTGAQLLPLPPILWQGLPGRAFMTQLDALTAQEDIWRPWTISPSLTLNAFLSLLVPAATLLLLILLPERERLRLPGLVLIFIVLATLIGLLQYSGQEIQSPFVNRSSVVSGTFANRNHFALLLAIGCLITPVWAFAGEQGAEWRAPVALALITLFALTILATGSRAGGLTGLLALMLGLALCWHDIRRALHGAPRWVFPALIAAVVGVVALFVLVSIAADRAESVRRAFEIDPGEDMRTRGLPTVLSMIAAYFPVGAGFGDFDPIFRLHEPFSLLKPTYFNHAHNDFLEVVLDGGLPTLLLLLVAMGWYAIASVRAWRASGRHTVLPKLGSAILLLVLIASTFDYPARTPMMMAMIVIAASWLCQNRTASIKADFT